MKLQKLFIGAFCLFLLGCQTVNYSSYDPEAEKKLNSASIICDKKYIQSENKLKPLIGLSANKMYCSA